MLPLRPLQVGTAVVTRGKDARLALGRLGALVEQLEALVRSGREMILVTSGAVSVGRQKLRQQQILNSSPLEMQISGPSTVCSEHLQMVLAAVHSVCMGYFRATIDVP